MGLSTGAIFFYGGLTGLAVTLIAAIIIVAVQSSDRKRLRQQLDEEYGKANEVVH